MFHEVHDSLHVAISKYRDPLASKPSFALPCRLRGQSSCPVRNARARIRRRRARASSRRFRHLRSFVMLSTIKRDG